MENLNLPSFGFSSDGLRQGDFPLGSVTGTHNNMQPFAAGSYSYLQMRQFVSQGHPLYDRHPQGQSHQVQDPGSFGLPGFCSSYSQGSGLTPSPTSPYQIPPGNPLMRSMLSLNNPRMDDPMMFMRGRQVSNGSCIEDQQQSLPSFNSIYASAASNISTMPMTETFQKQQSHQSSCSPKTTEVLPANPNIEIKHIKHELPERSACFAAAVESSSTKSQASSHEAHLTGSSIDSSHPVTERITSSADLNSCSPANPLSLNPLNQNSVEVSENKNYSNQYCLEQSMDVSDAIEIMTQQFIQPTSDSNDLPRINQNSSSENYPTNLQDVQHSTIGNNSPNNQHNFANSEIQICESSRTVSSPNGNINSTSKPYIPESSAIDLNPNHQVVLSCSLSEPLTSETSAKSTPQVLASRPGSPKNAAKPPKVFLSSGKSSKKTNVRFCVLGKMENTRFVSRGTSTEMDENWQSKENVSLIQKQSVVSSPNTGTEPVVSKSLEENDSQEDNQQPDVVDNQEVKEESCVESELNETCGSFAEEENSLLESKVILGSPQDADDTMVSVASEDPPKTNENSESEHLLTGSIPRNFSLSGIQENISFDSSFGNNQTSTPLIRKKRLDIKVHIDESQCIMDGNQKRWQCNMCEKSYTTKSNLITHILGHRGIKPHICLVCGRQFKQLSHLNTHMLKHDNLKPHVCQICGKGFTQISHLKRHLVVHMDDKPHLCDICQRGFVYPSDLKTHKDKYPNGNCFKTSKSNKCNLSSIDMEEIRCTECKKAFKYPSQMKDHMLTHSSVRPFICTECGLYFLKEHHLKAHQFTHTGLKPFECTLCGRAFNQKANLVRHQLIHSDKRDYSCEICDKSFTQPQTLKAHMVVHSEKKPYQCKLCGKGFGRIHNLQGHMHIHENSKPFICFCGCSFSLRGNLNRHKKVKHGLNESTENMEAEAVELLNSFSERAKDGRKRRRDVDSDGPRTYLSNKNLTPIGFDDSCDRNDTENKLIPIPPEDGTNPSPRKQRKSMPRKVVARESSPELDGDLSEEYTSRFFTKGVLGLEETHGNNRFEEDVHSNCTKYNLQPNGESMSTEDKSLDGVENSINIGILAILKAEKSSDK